MTERLSWASGPVVRDGWRHSDVQWYPGMVPGRDHTGAIQEGLPWPDATFDYVVSHHGLMMLPEVDLVPALVELRRVTKPGGWLRVSVPDMDGAWRAKVAGRKWWFPVEAPDIDTAFCLYVTQGGATRSVFTGARLYRLLVLAGWQGARRVQPGDSGSQYPGIVELDSRPNETLFMDAVNPG